MYHIMPFFTENSFTEVSNLVFWKLCGGWSTIKEVTEFTNGLLSVISPIRTEKLNIVSFCFCSFEILLSEHEPIYAQILCIVMVHGL